MRRFMFIGDPSNYVGLERNSIYEQHYMPDVWNTRTVIDLFKDYPNEWQEVFDEEPEKLLHQTDLGYYAGLAMQGIMANPKFIDMGFDEIGEMSISTAKELIKQLKEQCQHNQ